MSSFSPSVPSLDLFSPAKTQNDISSCYFVKKGPSSAINESTDLEFVFEQVLPFIFCNFICVFLFPLVEMHIYIYIYILFLCSVFRALHQLIGIVLRTRASTY